MTDQTREAVIKEFKDNYRRYSPGYAHVLVRNWAIRDAIDLLEAQEPVLAVKLQSKKYIGRTGIAYDGSCGNCNAYLMRAWRACPLCGRAVKWE